LQDIYIRQNGKRNVSLQLEFGYRLTATTFSPSQLSTFHPEPIAILRLNDSAGINMTNGALLFIRYSLSEPQLVSTSTYIECMGFVQFMSKWPSLMWHTQTHTQKHTYK